MTTLGFKRRFMSGLQYLNYQQSDGKEFVDTTMLTNRFEFGKKLYSKDLFSHYGCVNAVEFSNDGKWLVSGGDDKRVLIWNVDKALSGSHQPKAMKGEHNSNIFCLGFSNNQKRLFSAGNDEQVILHDMVTGEVLDVFLHDEAVYGLSVDPINENLFASACDDGRVSIWDSRKTSNDSLTVAQSSTAYHAVMHHPVDPRFIATANAKEGVCLWDIRSPLTAVVKYGSSLLSQGAMSVRFNSAGTSLLALRRRFPPVLYDVAGSIPIAEFDHQEYYNSCTMKSCCFAGTEDQYVVSGSDDFKLYIWKIPDEVQFKKGNWISKAHLVLRGHRSIVNQVRYNKTYGLLASSGVEKVIKFWSSFPLTYQENHSSYVSSSDSLRKVYSHEEYINLVLESGQFMSHDYSHHSVQEDPRMMAFFDSLVQRDIEGWTSDSSNTTEVMKTCYVVQSSNSPSSSSTSSSDEELRDARSTRRRSRIFNGSNTSGQSPMSLSYVTKQSLANNVEPRDSNAEEERRDPLLDKISILIAQKRKEQMLKVTRSSMHLNKRDNQLISERQELSDEPGTSKKTSFVGESASEESEPVRAIDFTSAFLISMDRRRLLRRKRARLSRDPSLDHRSSDTDESNTEPTINSNRTWCNIIDSSSSSNSNASKNGESSKKVKCNNCRRVFFQQPDDANDDSVHENCDKTSNSVIDEINPDQQNQNHVSSVINPSEISVCNSEIQALENVSSIASSSNCISFNLKGGKKNGRNYRKRNAEDVEEDI